MSSAPTVFVVDDDQQTRDSVCILVRSMGLDTQAFCSAEDFLSAYQGTFHGCLVTDMRLQGMSGMELLEELKRRDVLLPVIVVTAYPRTRMTVRAIQAGAVDLLEKPYDEEELWDAIRKAIADDRAQRGELQRREFIRSCYARLTPQERMVLGMIVQGKSSKVIAHELDISVRTVETRRSEVLAKMQADSVIQLVRLVIDADLENSPPGLS